MNILQTAAALVLALLVSGVYSQIEGTTDLCSCSPSVFNFTLDFAGTCPGNLEDADGNLINDAFNDTSCFVTVLAADNSNEVPVIVESAIILELNKDTVSHQLYDAGRTLTISLIFALPRKATRLLLSADLKYCEIGEYDGW